MGGVYVCGCVHCGLPDTYNHYFITNTAMPIYLICVLFGVCRETPEKLPEASYLAQVSPHVLVGV